MNCYVARTLRVLFVLTWCSKSRFTIAACNGPVFRPRMTNEYEALVKCRCEVHIEVSVKVRACPAGSLPTKNSIWTSLRCASCSWRLAWSIQGLHTPMADAVHVGTPQNRSSLNFFSLGQGWQKLLRPLAQIADNFLRNSFSFTFTSAIFTIIPVAD